MLVSAPTKSEEEMASRVVGVLHEHREAMRLQQTGWLSPQPRLQAS